MELDVHRICAHVVPAPLADMTRSVAPRVGGNTKVVHSQRAHDNDEGGDDDDDEDDRSSRTSATVQEGKSNMVGEPRLRVMATTAVWRRDQYSEESEGAESVGDLKEPQSAEFEEFKEEDAKNTKDWMKESTLQEHGSSTAEKKAWARRAKRRA
mmetsp:Transcript_97350/g.313711  ORF Transcript_97350/g.313711 Transcript_97350/m.313711 type:complete len:154 (+) Transcript_97350:1281-1742(+)